MSHIDYSANGVIEKEEIERFWEMFNNGADLGCADGAETEPPSEPVTSAKV